VGKKNKHKNRKAIWFEYINTDSYYFKTQLMLKFEVNDRG
jgi:hypothetical protein